MQKAVEDQYARMWQYNDIIFCELLVNDLNLEIAKALVATRHRFTKDSVYPHVVYITNLVSVSKEARDYLSQGEAVRNIPAAAFICRSLISKLMATFFMAFNKPQLPIKIFTDKEDALKWIEKYKVLN